jgi:hypothetical protein
MPAEAMGPIGELGAVGNVARVSKKATAVPQDLVSFVVKKGDNGGVIVCETYEKKTPAGRRASSYPGGGDYKENPFGPDGGAEASSHIEGLLGQMGVSAPAPAPTATVAARGPMGGGAAAQFSGPPMGGEPY